MDSIELARHLDLLESLLGPPGVAASLATDARLAALAIEYQAEVHSNDADFGLRQRTPAGIAGSSVAREGSGGTGPRYFGFEAASRRSIVADGRSR